MDLDITLTERERQMLLDAIVAWEAEGCYNSAADDLSDDDFYGLLDKLKADPSIYGPLHMKPPAGIEIPVPEVDLSAPCGSCTHTRGQHALYLDNHCGRCSGSQVGGVQLECENQCTEFQPVDPQ